MLNILGSLDPRLVSGIFVRHLSAHSPLKISRTSPPTSRIFSCNIFKYMFKVYYPEAKEIMNLSLLLIR